VSIKARKNVILFHTCHLFSRVLFYLAVLGKQNQQGLVKKRALSSTTKISRLPSPYTLPPKISIPVIIALQELGS